MYNIFRDKLIEYVTPGENVSPVTIICLKRTTFNQRQDSRASEKMSIGTQVEQVKRLLHFLSGHLGCVETRITEPESQPVNGTRTDGSLYRIMLQPN